MKLGDIIDIREEKVGTKLRVRLKNMGELEACVATEDPDIDEPILIVKYEDNIFSLCDQLKVIEVFLKERGFPQEPPIYTPAYTSCVKIDTKDKLYKHYNSFYE